jgi:EF-P beta-lysylation protein EpmB
MAILATIHDSVRAGLGWKDQMKRAIRDPFELAKQLNLPRPTENQAAAAIAFGLFVPEHFLKQIKIGDPSDPLLLQVLPRNEEVAIASGFSADPLEEANAKRADGLLQKYEGRVLLITNSVCAINCRYCFRRHFPYEQTPHSESQWQNALEQIRQDVSIEEVILSGGDPLTLVDEKLIPIVQQVDAIEHVSRIRFHSRLPVVIPDRITKELVELLSNVRSKVVFVIHSNHANELDPVVESALGRLSGSGCQLLNQSVLLRGVNDDPKTLVNLSKRLLECNVLPYYLHQLDRVQGAAHFEVAMETGKHLIAEIRSKLPGYAVPRYAIEEPGKLNKTIIA